MLLIASQNVTAAQAEAQAQPDLTSVTIRMFSALAIILGVLLLALYIAKKAGFKTRSFLGTRHMEVVDRMYLGPKKSILLIRIGHDFLLIGLAASQISFLSKVEGPGRKDVAQSKLESPIEQYDAESCAESGRQAAHKDTSLQRTLKRIIPRYFDRMIRREVGQ